MSTATFPAAAAGPATVDLDTAWGLSPRVAVRPEPFGALVYHFGNRRLSFLKRLDLVDVVQNLDAHPTVRAALAAVAVPIAEWPAYLTALDGLARADMICRRSPAEPEEYR